MKDYDNSFNEHGSSIQNVYNVLIKEYRNIITNALMNRYFSTRKYPKLRVVDISFYFDGRIIIHGMSYNSPTYHNFAPHEVTFL